MELFTAIVAGTVLGTIIFIVFIMALPTSYKSSQKVGTSKGRKKPSVQILVLGDIGRSPRMQYHALSIASHGGEVQIIGYKESELHPKLMGLPEVTVIPIPAPSRYLKTNNQLLFLVFGPLKVLWQVVSLWRILGYQAKPSEWLLLQNPPSIPTLAIAQAVCFLRNTHLLIDWHNFGWSILALRLGQDHLLVRISRWYEKYFGQFATAHFTVTRAMARVLKDEYRVKSAVLPLHDRPPLHFQPFNAEQQDDFLSRLPETREFSTSLKAGAMKLVVSSTSWTADEDFSILLSSLVEYSASATTSPQSPALLVIITGKGPQKSHYVKEIQRLEAQNKLAKVTILTAWLSASDYASLLASASLGVSLHTSSSGVDLPMKVVDMFGAGLPVVGWSDFEAWPELVKENVNGKGFKSVEELTALLIKLFGGGEKTLESLRQGALEEGKRRWDDEWNAVAGRLLGFWD